MLVRCGCEKAEVLLRSFTNRSVYMREGLHYTCQGLVRHRPLALVAGIASLA
jgi:hypothetical protein